MTRQTFDGVAVEAPPTTKPSHPFWGSVRMTYAICAFLAMVVHLCMRNTLNFVILCMVKRDSEDYAAASGQPQRISSPCADNVNVNSSNVIVKTGDLSWTRSQEILIQGTFYYGYVFTLPIAGRLADKFGGKFFFIHSITAQAVVFMLIPLFAKISFVAAFIVRLLQGLIAGCGNPALYQLFTTWAHSTERTALLSFAYGGYAAGALLTFPISGLLCQIGWESAFYVMGTISLLFGICCHWLVYSRLEEHPRLSAEEYDYLKASNEQKSSAQKVPWRAIFTSIPVYAFILTHLFHSYGIILFTLMIPRFLKEAMGFSLQEIGIYATAPFLGSILSKLITIFACGRIEKRPNLNGTRFRRIVYAVCNCITILFVLGIIYTDCKRRIFVVLYTLCIGIVSDVAFAGGYWPSLLFLSPTYSGLLSGIANCLATFSGFLAPLGISKIVLTGDVYEWNYVMLTLVAAYCLGALIYGMFGSSELQSWGNNTSTNTGNKCNNHNSNSNELT